MLKKAGLLLQTTDKKQKPVDRTRISKNELCVLFSDGTQICWHNALLNGVRGVKCGRLWCDRDIDKNVLEHILYGSCYFGEEKDIIWI